MKLFFIKVFKKIEVYLSWLICLLRVLNGVVFKSYSNKVIYLSFFHEVKNIGDLLNIDIIQFYSKKKVVNVPPFFIFKHYLVIGSILQNMNRNSVVIGSGLIHDSKINKMQQVGDIRAVRGHLTKKCIEDLVGKNLEIPLGDPALLFPKIYNPKIDVIYEFGLILHYVDEGHGIKSIVENMGGKIISARQNPEEFVSEMKACKKILASSMHGLILSDAYNIPNKRLILGDKIYGGDFKFKDYYSTTDSPDEKGCIVSESVSAQEVIELLLTCSVKKYVGDLGLLENKLLELRKV
ncbi:polysaccharide pyruvyl transferase family protein [Marinomonas polaris]|uniref:polysaccharide pyruvyl transferase family protein n=1 Tax=Marinomonas polaris TaxID=293552 RepID=UPI0035198A24